LGTHTYVRLPLAKGASAEDTLVYAPVSKIWELDQMIPTGRTLPVPAELELANGGPLAGRKFDTTFTDLRPDSDGQIHTWLREPGSGRSLAQRFDPMFTQCVVYTPPHREAICLEPYTCVPDAIRLSAAGHATGLRVLQPGAALEATIVIAVNE
jgi:aldose 1-epimerase